MENKKPLGYLGGDIILFTYYSKKEFILILIWHYH